MQLEWFVSGLLSSESVSTMCLFSSAFSERVDIMVVFCFHTILTYTITYSRIRMVKSKNLFKKPVVYHSVYSQLLILTCHYTRMFQNMMFCVDAYILYVSCYVVWALLPFISYVTAVQINTLFNEYFFNKGILKYMYFWYIFWFVYTFTRIDRNTIWQFQKC